MQIKTYKDGERLVIIVEGLENIPSDDAQLKGFLSVLVPNTDVQVLTSPDAKPVPIEEDVPSVVESVMSDIEARDIEVETSFFKGKLTDAYSHVDSVSKELELLHALNDNAESYLRHKFSKIDASSYTEKLSAAQKERFFEVYGPFMYPQLVETKDVKSVIEYYQET